MREHAHVDERLAHAQLDPAPDEREHGAGGEQRRATRADDQPQLLALAERDEQRDEREPTAGSRPGQSTRDGVLIGDSGTKRCTSTSATRP